MIYIVSFSIFCCSGGGVVCNLKVVGVSICIGDRSQSSKINISIRGSGYVVVVSVAG